jgi:hypothetical protein
VRRATSGFLHDRLQSLTRQHLEAQAEFDRLRREETYLVRQVREARSQLRYYEDLLTALRRDWGRTPALRELVRRLG